MIRFVSVQLMLAGAIQLVRVLARWGEPGPDAADLLLFLGLVVLPGSISFTVVLDTEDQQAFHDLWQRAAAKTLQELKQLVD